MPCEKKAVDDVTELLAQASCEAACPSSVLGNMYQQIPINFFFITLESLLGSSVIYVLACADLMASVNF